jgi:phosphoribosylamine---glycine ligase
MQVLIVGGGGREHAIAWKIKQSSQCSRLFCVPGNAGTATIAENVTLPTESVEAIALWALENKIDLTIVGPEAPLADGIVDVFAAHGLRIFGPTKAAAQLEASKSFAKEVMNKAGVPTPRGEVFTDYQSARNYLESLGAPVVVKADGLAAGKGVTVATSIEQALQALDECFNQRRFGTAGSRVVIEECINGREASVMALVDGSAVLPLVVSQDYKRLEDGDQGPNTGGMGAISPTPVLGDRRVESLIGQIFMPVIRELMNRGIVYKGFLYAGVMVDQQGVAQVLEFNCRLGDPETEVLMARLQSDFLAVVDAAVDGRLSSVDLKWHGGGAACVVLTSRGYPGEVDDGKVISGLENTDPSVMVFHAGTRNGGASGGEVISKGGRILTVTATGTSVQDAVEKVYRRIESISFDGAHYRRDVANSTPAKAAS